MLDALLGNDLLIGIIAFLLVLIPAVIIHELGHFLAAKSVGITILEFGVGMPPRAARLFRAGGTDYTLNWLPLGGFVRPIGEGLVSQQGEEETESDRAEAIRRGIKDPKSVNEVKPLPRIWFMAAGSIFNFISAFLLLVAVPLIGIPEVVGGRTLIVDVQPDSVFSAAGLQDGDIIERVNGETFMTGDELLDTLYTASGPVTLSVLRNSSDLQSNTLEDAEPQQIEVVVETGLGGQRSDTSHPLIIAVSPGSPAADAGLQVGDVVTAINDAPIASFEEVRAQVEANVGSEISLTVRREGEGVTVSLTPRLNPPPGEGAMGVAFAGGANATVDSAAGLVYIDTVPQVENRPQPLDVAVPFAWEQMGSVLTTIIQLPGRIIEGAVTAEEVRPVGPVGIGQLGGMVLQQSVEQNDIGRILQFIALVSISLGFTNLLPIPALDGGRILFVLIEVLRGKPIAPEREGMVHLVGMVVLLSLMLVVTFFDILSPITNSLPR
ncbi:MAG: RIP metalloprotease RseP [Chloroflexota bacterium]|nr:RIP metalloprotease RseP [Chloroflexota bacterium]